MRPNSFMTNMQSVGDFCLKDCSSERKVKLDQQ